MTASTPKVGPSCRVFELPKAVVASGVAAGKLQHAELFALVNCGSQFALLLWLFVTKADSKENKLTSLRLPLKPGLG